jgi:small subunit ribosomal protein S17
MAKEMRKVRVGSVVRTRMDKTAVVEMVWKQRHTIYNKQMRRVARFYVHDPEGQCQIGDTVRIQETRPISRTKHWRLLEVLRHRQLADVSPIELETDITPVMTGEALAEAPSQAQPGDAGEVEGETDDDLDEDTEE